MEWVVGKRHLSHTKQVEAVRSVELDRLRKYVQVAKHEEPRPFRKDLNKNSHDLEGKSQP